MDYAFGFVVLGAVLAGWVLVGWVLVGVRYIPHRRVGVVERLWSPRGALKEGHLLALRGEAGFQSEVLRGGIHLGFSPLGWRVHPQPLVTVPEGQIGYVYARDGQPLEVGQTLGRVVACNHFQDVRQFLEQGGQRGRQRAILREGVYAINTSQFVVLTKEVVYAGPVTRAETVELQHWQQDLKEEGGFEPVVVSSSRESDPIGASPSRTARRWRRASSSPPRSRSTRASRTPRSSSPTAGGAASRCRS